MLAHGRPAEDVGTGRSPQASTQTTARLGSHPCGASDVSEAAGGYSAQEWMSVEQSGGKGGEEAERTKATRKAQSQSTAAYSPMRVTPHEPSIVWDMGGDPGRSEGWSTNQEARRRVFMLVGL